VDLVSAYSTTSIDGLRQMEKNPNTAPMTAWKELKKQNYPGGSKAHDEGIRRLLCDSGVSAGERPEHRKGSDAAH
jgi:hypothetical protein